VQLALENPPGSKDIPGAGLDAEGMAVLLEALKVRPGKTQLIIFIIGSVVCQNMAQLVTFLCNLKHRHEQERAPVTTYSII